MKLINRPYPALSHIAHPAPSRAGVASRWPTKRAIGAAYHWLLGTDNTGDLCQITGKRLHPNLRAYVADGGSAYTVAPTVTLPDGAVANAILSSSAARTVTKVSGGTGYTSIPSVGVTATLAPGGRLPRYTAILSATTVSALAANDNGFGLLTDPVITITGGGGSGASFTTALYRSVKIINVTAGGSGYTGAPTVVIGSAGADVVARAIAIVAAGAVTQVLLLDGGVRFTSTPAVSFTGGGGTGATATAVLGTNCVRSLELTDCGSQTASAAAVFAGGDGTGASGGTLMTGAVYTRSAGFLTIPAGGTTDVNGQNGLLLPMLDTGEFTVFVVVKKATAGSSQVIMGSSTEMGNPYGGFDIKNLIGTGYRVLDYNLQITASLFTTPGVAGDWITIVYATTPVAGESLTPSATVVQSSRYYTRSGLQTALTALTGERIALNKRRLIGIGNTQQTNVSYRGALDVAEVIGYQRALSDAEITAEIAAIAARLALRAITVVN